MRYALSPVRKTRGRPTRGLPLTDSTPATLEGRELSSGYDTRHSARSSRSTAKSPLTRLRTEFGGSPPNNRAVSGLPEHRKEPLSLHPRHSAHVIGLKPVIHAVWRSGLLHIRRRFRPH